MVKHVSIQNFKSIKSLEFEARRVNVFIGEPNTGKSNILEALGVFTPNIDWREIIRYEREENIFSESDSTEKILINVDDLRSEMWMDNKLVSHLISIIGWKIIGNITDLLVEPEEEDLIFRFYRFQIPDSFKANGLKYLQPPNGENLFSILLSNQKLRERVSEILAQKGLKLNIRMGERTLEAVREKDGLLLSYPYKTISDTLQRIVFYLAAIETNKDAVLLFEEPEANTFPYYTKQLAERIAADESNQYFLVTHNPYFLNSLVQQTRIEDLNVFVTYMEDYQTKVRPLSEDDFSKILDLDKEVFYNLDILGHNA